MLNCFTWGDSYIWLPGKVSTYILPVMEIEMTWKSLTYIYDHYEARLPQENRPLLLKQIKKWGTILTTYRGYNSQLTAVFSTVDLQYRSMVKMFENFRDGGITAEDLVGAVDYIFLEGKDKSFTSEQIFKTDLRTQKLLGNANLKMDYRRAFNKFDKACTNDLLPQHQSSYLQGICADFDKKKWKDAYSVVTSACDMPGSGSENLNAVKTPKSRKLENSSSELSPEFIQRRNLQNALKDTSILKEMCQTKDTDWTDFPGGVSGGKIKNQGMWDFLKTPKTRFLTFGSNAPTTIAWTSAVSDALSFSSSLTQSLPEDVFVEGEMALTMVIANLETATNFVYSHSHTIDIGKTADQSHSFERTVTISLDDADAGI